METTLIVQGMTCGGCEKSVRSAILQTPGIADVQIDRSRNQATLTFTAQCSTKEQQRQATQAAVENVEVAGFDCRLPPCA